MMSLLNWQNFREGYSELSWHAASPKGSFMLFFFQWWLLKQIWLYLISALRVAISCRNASASSSICPRSAFSLRQNSAATKIKCEIATHAIFSNKKCPPQKKHLMRQCPKMWHSSQVSHSYIDWKIILFEMHSRLLHMVMPSLRWDPNSLTSGGYDEQHNSDSEFPSKPPNNTQNSKGGTMFRVTFQNTISDLWNPSAATPPHLSITSTSCEAMFSSFFFIRRMWKVNNSI